jgi:hypothetical protein
MKHVSCQQVQEQLLDLAGSSVPREAGPLREHLDSCPACKAYWAALCADDALLRACIDALQPAVARIEAGVMRQLAQVPPPSGVSALHRPAPAAAGDMVRTRLLRLPLLRNPRMGIAVAAVLALGLYLLFGRATLYDEVMNALGEVQTVHLVDAAIRDGRWQKRVELWYNRDAGVAATTWQGDRAIFQRLDNGQRGRIVVAGTVLEDQPSSSTTPLQVVADLLQTGLFDRGFARVAQEDKAVEGGTWRAYSLSDGTGTVHLLAWLDEAKRVRAWEKRRLLKDGTWETYRTGTIEYGVTPDPALFQPNLAPEVNIVDVDRSR